jgi:predicted O-methyltransferase YrrM
LIKKFIHLNRVDANYKIKLHYLFFLFNSLFFRRDRKKSKNKFRDFLKNKKLSQDWFSHNVYDWQKTLENYTNIKFEYLEIGSFEGCSGLYIAENYPGANLTCVDAWDANTIGNENLNLKNIELNFDENISEYKKRCLKIKMKSIDFFSTNKNRYNVIYIDGSHEAIDVFNDCTAAWKILENEGTMIMDDFFWRLNQNIINSPAKAIVDFFNTIEGEYKILKLTKYQISIRKTIEVFD